MEPANKELEYQVLGGMLNKRECLYDGLSELNEEMFSDEGNVTLFKRISEESSNGITTAKTLMNKVKDQKEKALIRLVDNAYVDRQHFDKALGDLKDTYIKRQLYYSIDKTLSRMDSETSDELISSLEQDISNFYFDDTSENIIDPSERGPEALSEFYELLADPDKAKGLPFSVQEGGHTIGFPSLDEVFNGAQGGDLIMIAAKTGEGKTALAINLARLFSIYQNYLGFYENAEMKVRELESRLLAPIADVKSKELYYAKIEGTEAKKKEKMEGISAAYNRYMKSKLFLSRIPNLPLHKAKGLARQLLHRTKTLDFLVIDYIGRMEITDRKRNMQQWDELYEITKQLKELAMTLNVPIFMLAQRNQAGDVEGAKKMMNECDGVLYFEPVTEDDEKFINETLPQHRRKYANYAIRKKKVRRDDNPAPIYVNFDKAKQFINEVPKY